MVVFAVGIISITGSASMAEAINISSASVQNGLAVIGGKAAAGELPVQFEMRFPEPVRNNTAAPVGRIDAWQ
jgi:hypothetical protein